MTTIWLIACVVLLIIELVSGTVVALCLSVGCLIAIVPALLGASVLVQAVIGLVASMLTLVFLGPAIRRLYSRSRNTHKTATNMDALIGRVGKVSAPVTNHYDDNGRVKIDGDNWLAYTTDPDVPLLPGTQVVVEAYESLVLKVRPL